MMMLPPTLRGRKPKHPYVQRGKLCRHGHDYWARVDTPNGKWHYACVECRRVSNDPIPVSELKPPVPRGRRCKRDHEDLWLARSVNRRTGRERYVCVGCQKEANARSTQRKHDADYAIRSIPSFSETHPERWRLPALDHNGQPIKPLPLLPDWRADDPVNPWAIIDGKVVTLEDLL